MERSQTSQIPNPLIQWASTSMSMVSWNNSESHSTTLAQAISSLHTSVDTDSSSTDLILICEGRTIPVHRLVVATSSPYLAKLVIEADSTSPICLVGVKYKHAVMVVQFMYTGVLERISEQEVDILLEATKHLQITGLNHGRTAIVKTEIDLDAQMEDDVFADTNDNEHAVDLSPVTRWYF